MELATEIHNFIQHPFPLWETTLTSLLVANKWGELKKEGITSAEKYSTCRAWFRDSSLERSKTTAVVENSIDQVYLEERGSSLKVFYAEHGLELLNENELEANNALQKVKNAIQVLKCIPSAYHCVVSFVKRIEILKQQDSEVDLSYSHPDWIFRSKVSHCSDQSEPLKKSVIKIF